MCQAMVFHPAAVPLRFLPFPSFLQFAASLHLRAPFPVMPVRISAAIVAVAMVTVSVLITALLLVSPFLTRIGVAVVVPGLCRGLVNGYEGGECHGQE